MKIFHQITVAASVLMFAGMSATKAIASDFTFTQKGWGNFSADTTLLGSFSGTPAANGQIDLNDLSAFNANLAGNSWNLQDVSEFNYNPFDNLLTFSAVTSETATDSNPFITITSTVSEKITVNSFPQQPSRFSVNVSIFNTNIGTVFSSESFENPQVTQISDPVQQVPESSNTGASLVAIGIGGWLVNKKKK